MSDEVIYVVSQEEIYRDADALERLRANNDSQYVEDGTILKVPESRWEAAQTYERETWMKYNVNATADRNREHEEGFGGYSGLRRDLGNVIEIGCGPFTNLQFILQDRTAQSVTLLDPLIEQYKQHPHCTYADGTLLGNAVETIALPLERWNTRKRFDTIVMVNVLPHCYDARDVLGTVKRLLKKGGTLVFHEAPRVIDPSTHYDAGHPLMYDASFLNAFLDKFEQVSRNGWYFIGRDK